MLEIASGRDALDFGFALSSILNRRATRRFHHHHHHHHHHLSSSSFSSISYALSSPQLY
jgi:G3E family GTPase